MANDVVNNGVLSLLRLRRAERRSDADLRSDLAIVREFVMEVVGPTISRAQASRLLGVSQTALDRWIARGEIAAIMTPSGRREVPVTEIVGLLDEMESLRGSGVKRPLATVIHDRQRRSAETIDVGRLLPSKRRRGHRVAELQSLAYHRLVAERLDEELVDEARRRVRRWREDGRLQPGWADAWERVLALPLPRMARAIGADTERARELRQTSPFAGVLTEQERRRLMQAVEQRA